MSCPLLSVILYLILGVTFEQTVHSVQVPELKQSLDPRDIAESRDR